MIDVAIDLNLHHEVLPLIQHGFFCLIAQDSAALDRRTRFDGENVPRKEIILPLYFDYARYLNDRVTFWPGEVTSGLLALDVEA